MGLQSEPPVSSRDDYSGVRPLTESWNVAKRRFMKCASGRHASERRLPPPVAASAGGRPSATLGSEGRASTFGRNAREDHHCHSMVSFVVHAKGRARQSLWVRHTRQRKSGASRLESL